jgi:hypothetical protein
LALDSRLRGKTAIDGWGRWERDAASLKAVLLAKDRRYFGLAREGRPALTGEVARLR